MDLYCRADEHRWEDKVEDMEEGATTPCCTCIASAKKLQGQLITIMCSDLGCLNPAWRPQSGQDDIWVCEEHFVGVILA